MTVYELDRVQAAQGRFSSVRNASSMRTRDLARRIERSRLALRFLGGLLAVLVAVAIVMAVVATAHA